MKNSLRNATVLYSTALLIGETVGSCGLGIERKELSIVALTDGKLSWQHLRLQSGDVSLKRLQIAYRQLFHM